MHILVTGAAGFIGFHLARRLINDGFRVTGLDNINDYYDIGLKYGRLAELGISKEVLRKNTITEADFLSEASGFRFHYVDIENKKDVDGLFEDSSPDVVVHLAAQAGVRNSLKNPYSYIDSNITGFLNILEACRAYPVRHLIYASSSSVYGANTTMPFSVRQNVDHPVSLYAASKKASEVMASNATTLTDEDGDYEDWIELYNPTNEPIPLNGYGESDNYHNPYRWVLPDTIIEAKGFLVLWASGKNRRTVSEELHTNFRISQEGEEVLLTNIQGERLDEMAPRLISTDVSYGRYPDGGDDWFYFYDPTPGKSNRNTGFVQLMEAPQFSHVAGFYQNVFDLEITSPSGNGLILYTLDGSEPDPNNIDEPRHEFLVNYYFADESKEPEFKYIENRMFVDDRPIRIDPALLSDNRAADIITTYSYGSIIGCRYINLFQKHGISDVIYILLLMLRI